MKKSWKNSSTIPGFLLAAVQKGLRIADSIGVEEANDKTWLTITFKKLAARGPAPADDAVDPHAPSTGPVTPRAGGSS